MSKKINKNLSRLKVLKKIVLKRRASKLENNQKT